jgi:hypothetical protein
MGKVESKSEIKNNKGINSKIQTDIICPLCNRVIKGNTTFNQLNTHLKSCEFHSKGNHSERIEIPNVIQNKIKSNIDLPNPQIDEMLDKNYVEGIKIQRKNSALINSEPHRTRKNSLNSSDKSNGNDFQLVIDYNNTKNPDLYEEKLINEGKKEQVIDKYTQLRIFLMNKKNLMNFDLNVECKNYKEIFYAIKNCNIYYNTKFIFSPASKKPKILTLNIVLDKYFELMAKNHNFTVYNDNVFFSFGSSKVDYEMLGIILSILFIYPEIKLKYKLPLILFKLLVNQRLELNDIKFTETNLYNNLYILSKDKNINSKGLVYVYEGNELLIDGKNIKVNNKNISDYIEKLVNYHFRRYKNNINVIKSNLFQFIPKKYIFYFSGEELYRIINRI